MRNLVRTAAVAATGGAALAGVLVASAASATSAGHPAGELPSTHGTTTITTTPVNALHTEGGIGNTMVYNGVMPTAMAPAKETLLDAGLLFFNPSGFSSQFRFTLPVVAGELSPHSLRGTVRHSGGIMFSDRHSLLEITHLVADLKHKTMTGTLTPQPGSGSRRITLFRLDLSHARVRPGKNDTRVTGIGLDFSRAAAAALDHILATKTFRAGLEFGTAAITLDNVAGLPASSRS
jgi:hypothetical protein